MVTWSGGYLTCSNFFGSSSTAALIFTSRLVQRKIVSVTAAFDKWGSATLWFETVIFALEPTLNKNWFSFSKKFTDDWLNVADAAVTHVKVADINEAAFGKNMKSATFDLIWNRPFSVTFGHDLASADFSPFLTSATYGLVFLSAILNIWPFWARSFDMTHVIWVTTEGTLLRCDISLVPNGTDEKV